MFARWRYRQRVAPHLISLGRATSFERNSSCTVGSNRAVLFDLHDTLVHLVPSIEEAMAAAIADDRGIHALVQDVVP